MGTRHLPALVTLLMMALAAGCEEPAGWEAGPCPTEVMAAVNDYWIAEHPTPGDNEWARAAYFTGDMAAYELLGDSVYLDYALEWAEDHDWELNQGMDELNADDQCAGQTYLALYELDPQPERIAHITASVDEMVEGTARDDWWWVDALFMALPVFAQLGEIHDDDSYADAMVEFYEHTRVARQLYDDDAGLWYRDENYLYPEVTTPNGEKVFWSRGEGWAMGALVRTLDHLPEDSPHRQRFVDMLQTMAAALSDVQRDDGMWNVSLHDPEDHPGPETSGTAFFTYGIAWGINRGVLDRDTYLPVVEDAWLGMVDNALHESGKLGFVQGVGEAPDSAQPVTYKSTEDFGVGAFLLAGSEVHNLGIDWGCDP